eukprot:1303764-Rhodomonas_salina.4
MRKNAFSIQFVPGKCVLAFDSAVQIALPVALFPQLPMPGTPESKKKNPNNSILEGGGGTTYAGTGQCIGGWWRYNICWYRTAHRRIAGSDLLCAHSPYPQVLFLRFLVPEHARPQSVPDTL